MSEKTEYKLSEYFMNNWDRKIRVALDYLQEIFWKWTILHPDGETSEPKGKKKCIKCRLWGNPNWRCLSNHASCHF